MSLDRREFLRFASGAVLTSAAPIATGAGGEEDPLGVRADFPASQNSVYLNSAYIAPIPSQVYEAGRAFLDRKLRGPVPLGDMQAKTNEVRGQYARLVNASPDEIGFLFATSEGENIVARAIGLKAGDNVVVDALHYDTSFFLYRELERTHAIELRIVPHRDGAVAARDFEPHVDRHTRLLSVALVSHQNGFRHDMKPLADLAHAHGAFCYADAVQAVGMVPVDVRAMGVDFMTAGTYKWLLGGFASAPFFIRRELLDRVPPDRFGALGAAKELPGFRYESYTTARKYEYATLPFAEVYQLGASLAYLERVGVDRIEQHTVGLAKLLHEGLMARGLEVVTPAGNRSSIVSFVNPKAPAPVQAAFAAARVQVSFREDGRQIRVSAALFNNRQDVERCLTTIDEALRL